MVTAREDSKVNRASSAQAVRMRETLAALISSFHKTL